MISIMPDIAYAAEKLSRYSKYSRIVQWTAPKRIFRYINGNKNYASLYSKLKDGLTLGYSDADWAGNLRNGKLTSRNLFSMARVSISLCSWKQTIVAKSFCDAQYIPLTESCREAESLLRLLGFILKPLNNMETNIRQSNSQSAIGTSRNESIYRRIKHIDNTTHFEIWF